MTQDLVAAGADLAAHVFDRFSTTPRLALSSPVRGCGKTTVLTLIELLVPEGNRTDSVSAAAIYHQPERRPRTDEADGLNLLRSHALRSVFNSGHRCGGAVSRNRRPDYFQAGEIDRSEARALVEQLIKLDEGQWGEWRGSNDDRPPCKLTQPQLAQLLRPFGINSRTIWPLRRRLGDKSSRGYVRSQFEQAWAAYCPSADTPTQSSKIIRLLRS
jgi:hypothetical protein